LNKAILLVVICLTLSSCSLPNFYAPVIPSKGNIEDEFNKNSLNEETVNVSVYKAVKDCVVGINTTTIKRNFIRFVPVKGTGTGLIVSNKGFIITNYHVIDKVDKLQVELADQSIWDATVIGGSQNADIAMIKINAPENRLKAAVIGNSEQLNVGQRVLAIGNPFGLSGTLTTGIVSSLNRNLSAEDGTVMENIIQTDAAINPGNSGGPLINSRGEIIGINTAIFSPSGGNVGIGFAVPINKVKEVLKAFEDRFKVSIF